MEGIEKYVAKVNSKVYLKTKNGLLKNFDKVLDEIIEYNDIKFKSEIFFEGKEVEGLRNAGKYGNEIWISSKSKNKEETLVHEVLGLHYNMKDL